LHLLNSLVETELTHFSKLNYRSYNNDTVTNFVISFTYTLFQKAAESNINLSATHVNRRLCLA